MEFTFREMQRFIAEKEKEKKARELEYQEERLYYEAKMESEHGDWGNRDE